MPGSTATFGATTITNGPDIGFIAELPTLVGGFTFASWQPYTFTLRNFWQQLTFEGAGIVNGGNATFILNGAVVAFNSGTAGSATFNINDTTGGSLLFPGKSISSGPATPVAPPSTIAPRSCNLTIARLFHCFC